MKKTMRQKVFEFIRDRYSEIGIPPTRREVARRFNTSPQNVDQHIQKLIDDGQLQRVEAPVYGNVIPKKVV